MFSEVCRTVKRFKMLQQGEKIVVAVSGGPDSMALLHILRILQTDYDLELFAAHVNHMFRGDEARADEDFVRMCCARWDIPCFTIRIDVPARMAERGLSAQVAAREARYHYFKHIMAITGSTKIAAGHTADDQAETVLMRFLRGAGPEGLGGILPVREGIIRPLIGVSKAQIEEYCHQAGIEARWDTSNAKPCYLRNRIRNELLPYLEKEYNRGLRKNLINLSDILQNEEMYWANVVRREYAKHIVKHDDEIRIILAEFEKLEIAAQRRLLRAFFEQMGIPRSGYAHVEDVRSLIITGSVGTAVSLPGGYWASKNYKNVILAKGKAEQPVISVDPVALVVPGTVHIENLGAWIRTSFLSCCHTCVGEARTQYFRWEKLQKPLTVRTRLPGDRFFHTGIGHHKKLKDFFIDGKVPRAERDEVLLITHGKDILWVIGHYVDKRFLADKTAEKILRIAVGRD